MDTLALVGRLLVSLAAVLGVMWLIARRMRRGVRGKDSRLIDVIERQQLSRTASVSVIRVLDQALVVGVTDSQVRVLAELDLAAVQVLVAAPGSSGSSGGRRRRGFRTGLAADGHGAHAAGLPPTPPFPLTLAPDLATTRPVTDPPIATGRKGSALAGSALSPHTWKQTLESLRDLTTRSP